MGGTERGTKRREETNLESKKQWEEPESNKAVNGTVLEGSIREQERVKDRGEDTAFRYIHSVGARIGKLQFSEHALP